MSFKQQLLVAVQVALQVALQVVEQVYVKKLQPQKRRYETIEVYPKIWDTLIMKNQVFCD